MLGLSLDTELALKQVLILYGLWPKDAEVSVDFAMTAYDAMHDLRDGLSLTYLGYRLSGVFNLFG